MYTMSSKILFLFSFLAISSGLFAQSGINSTVRVEREYEGKIMEVDKSLLKTKVADSLYNFNLTFDYLTFYRPYKDLYEFSPVSTPPIMSGGKIKYPWLYAKFSAGYPLMPSAEIYVAPRFGNRFSAILSFNHHSLWSDSIGDRMENRVGGDFAYRWNKGEALLDLSYSGNYYTYMNGAESVGSHNYDILEVGTDIRSTNKDNSGFYYDLSLDYTYLKDKQSNPVFGQNSENAFDMELSLGGMIRRIHKLYVALGVDYTGVKNLPSHIDYYAGNVRIIPTYRFEKGRWNLNLGLDMAFDYSNDGLDDSGRSYIMPVVEVSFVAVPTKITLYAGVTPENEILSLSQMYKFNHWMGSDYTLGRYISPFNAKLGMQGVLGQQFAYNIYGGYKHYSKMTSYISYMDAQAVELGGNENFYAGGELRWNKGMFNMFGAIEYQYYKEIKKALMLPSLKVALGAEFNIRDRFYIATGVDYRNRVLAGSRSAGGEYTYNYLPGVVDLGLKLTLMINPKFAVFVEGKNLINNDIYYFSGICEPGVNIVGGLYFKL